MSVPFWFMEVARGMLPLATFSEIHGRAVVREREAVEQRPASPKIPVVSSAVLQTVSSYLDTEDAPQPPIKAHVAERMEKRLDIAAVTQGDMADLLRLIQAGGPNVQVVRQQMEMNQELVVNWRGKHFNVLWSKSRGKLITVLPKRSKKRAKVWTGRPREARLEIMADDD